MTTTDKTPRFTRQHFQMIADTIMAIPDYEQRVAMAYFFADKLRVTNPNFNRARFISAACGVKE